MSVPMSLSMPMPMPSPLPNGPRPVGPADPLTGYVSSAVPRVPGQAAQGEGSRVDPLWMYLVSRIISSAMYTRPALILLVRHEAGTGGEVENINLHSNYVEEEVLLLFLHNYPRKRGYFKGSERQAIQSNVIARESGFLCRTNKIIAGRVYHVTAQSSHASLRANQPQSCA